MSESKRTVTLEIVFRIQREYPSDWTDEQIEFHCNESNSCFDNLLEDRLKQSDAGGECTCFHGTARVVQADESESS